MCLQHSKLGINLKIAQGYITCANHKEGHLDNQECPGLR